MIDCERMLPNANRHDLVTVVSTVYHHGAAQVLDDRAQSFAEAFLVVTSLRVGWPGATHALDFTQSLDSLIGRKAPVESSRGRQRVQGSQDFHGLRVFSALSSCGHDQVRASTSPLCNY